MPLIFVDSDEINGKRVVTIEYSGFRDGLIESILDEHGIGYEKGGRVIIVDKVSKHRIRKILEKSGINPENIIVSGDIFGFKYLFKRISMKRELKLMCPRCKSTNVKKLSMLSGWLTPLRFICEDCGYSGAAFLEVEE